MNLLELFNRCKNDPYEDFYDNFADKDKTPKYLKFPVFVGAAVGLVALVFAMGIS